MRKMTRHTARFGVVILASFVMLHAEHSTGAATERNAADAPAASDDPAGKSARQPSLLIIGASSLNSPLPLTQLVSAMLASKGIQMHIEGQWPQLDAVTEQLGSKRGWDYVIIDAWHLGRGPNEFGASDVPARFPKAVGAFVKQVRAHSPNCKIILFPWWIPGRKATNEAAMEVFRRCVEQAKRNNIWVATTGPAFMEAAVARSDLRITKSKADAHPGIHGAYLNACSLYTILTGQSPVGLPATLIIKKDNGHKANYTLPPGDAHYLQKLAWKVYQREIKNTKPAKAEWR